MRDAHTQKALSAFDSALYLAQQLGGSHARRLIDEHGAWIVSTATGIARGLGVPIDELEDVAQETVRRLLDPEVERFDPDRGPAKQYVRGIALNAVGFAGRRRRAGRTVAPKEAWDAAVPGDTEDVDWRLPFRRVEARLAAVTLLRCADALVRRGGHLVFEQDLSQREAAIEMGISEFKLSRAFTAFYAEVRAAA